MATTQRRRPPSRATPKRKKKKGSTGWARTVAVLRRTHTWGWVLVALGVALTFGQIGAAAGPYGEVLSEAAGHAVGVARFVVPLLLVALGITLLRDAWGPEARRTTVATILLLLSCLGLAPHIGVYRNLPTPPKTPQVIPGLVRRDRKQPRFEPPARIERIGGIVYLKKRFLDHVLRRNGIPRETQHKALEFGRVTANEEFETGRLPIQILMQQLLVRWRVHATIVCLRGH